MKGKEPQFLTLEEGQNFLRQCDKSDVRGLRDFCILSLMLHTGLRRAEVPALARDALRNENGEAYVYARTKGGRERKISIEDPKLLESLPKYFQKTGGPEAEPGPMFLSLPRGPEKKIRPITDETIRRVVEKYVRLAGLKKRITPHSLRHSFITEALNAGADIATVRDLAGHSNLSTTSRYCHTTEERKKAAIAKIKF